MLSKVLTVSGVPFYIFGAQVDDMAYLWVCFLGCIDEVRNYAVTLSLSGKTNEKLSYHGNVHTLDDDSEDIVREEKDCLIVGRKLASRLTGKGHFFSNNKKVSTTQLYLAPPRQQKRINS